MTRLHQSRKSENIWWNIKRNSPFALKAWGIVNTELLFSHLLKLKNQIFQNILIQKRKCQYTFLTRLLSNHQIYSRSRRPRLDPPGPDSGWVRVRFTSVTQPRFLVLFPGLGKRPWERGCSVAVFSVNVECLEYHSSSFFQFKCSFSTDFNTSSVSITRLRRDDYCSCRKR